MKNSSWRFKLLNKFADNPSTISVSASILAIFGGLIAGLIVMIVASPSQAFNGFGTILTGMFRGGTTSMGNTIYYAVPIILTGLSVAFAFRTGLFNIGASGQVTVGAFTAVFLGYHMTFTGAWIVALLGAMLAGAVWGAIPGLLKAFRNVNEVVASIMLNYVAMYLNTMLIKALIYNQAYARAQAPSSNAQLPKWFLDNVFSGSQLNIGIFIAILVVIVTHIILNKTTFGYELKAVGFNKNASKYAGMNEKRNIVLAMTIAGAIAGIAGATLYLVSGKYLTPANHLMQEGFTGIAISLLGLSAPIGVFIAGLFYGALEMGGYYLQVTTTFVPQIIDIIIAVIIYFSALSLFLQRFVAEFIKRQIEKDVELAEGSEV